MDDWDIYEYCKWARVRLPAELEWEKGFCGTDGRQYPWGNAWESVRCHHAWSPGGKTTADVREYPEGRSPWGLYQMSGNVWELCKQGIDPYAGYCCRTAIPIVAMPRKRRVVAHGLTRWWQCVATTVFALVTTTAVPCSAFASRPT